MERDKENDAQGKVRQRFPEFVRDYFLQTCGLQSMAQKKVLELIHFAQQDSEKGEEVAHARIYLLHRLMGLRKNESDDIDNSVEGVSFLLSMTQELFPSWRYGAAFVKEFSAPSIQLPLEAVEFALDRIFVNKRYGGEVPELLMHYIRESANDVEKNKKKQVITKAQRPKQMSSTDHSTVDADFVLKACHDEFLKMEHESIDLLLAKYEEVDENGDGVLQFEEFSNFIAQIEPNYPSSEIAEMYNACAGDDDVIDRDEILQELSERGLLFNLRMTALD